MDQMIPDDVIQKLRLPKVGQIGYVVSDLSETVTFCRDALGIRPWLLLEERPDPCIEGTGRVYPLLRIALAHAGGVQIELIEVAEGESYHLEHLKKSEAEVHHLGFMVQDLERRLDEANAMGFGLIQRGTIREKGVTVEYAYLDTVETAGTVIEFIQWRLGPLPVPMNRTAHNLICELGSATLFRGRVIK
jgi:catechol 2,3-dioxygenase-like lactoylglutathione lyase family enzyme